MQLKWALLITTGLYLLQVAIAVLKYRKTTSFHTYSSKSAFILLGVFYIVLFLYSYVDWLFLCAIVLTILSIIEDIALTFQLQKPANDVKGFYWQVSKKEVDLNEY